MSDILAGSELRCASCGHVHPPSLRACPACGALAHADALKALAAQASAAAAAGRPVQAMGLWRDALDLLPPDSRQAEVIRLRLTELRKLPAETEGQAAQQGPAAARPQGLGGWLTAGALTVWKGKWVLAFLLGKGKLALAGLTKVPTLLSMLLTVGIYASLLGWRFALGIVLSIYVHELGHVAALRRLGMKADAPMFIPGLGAFVRLRQRPATVVEDAEVGLAGPIAGLLTALVCWGIGLGLDSPLLLALARVGAWINLFNLLPVWQLDGGRGFAAVGRTGRWLLAGLAIALTFWGGDTMLLLVGVLGGVRAMAADQQAGLGDRRTVVTFAVLLVALGLLASVVVPGIET